MKTGGKYLADVKTWRFYSINIKVLITLSIPRDATLLIKGVNLFHMNLETCEKCHTRIQSLACHQSAQ